MTTRPSLKLLVLTGSLSLAAAALHAQIVPGAQSNVTLSLTVSFTKENANMPSGPNTINSGRIVKASYGNKQLIADMNDAGDLPDKTVTGWKLVMVNRNPDDSNGVKDRSFYLVKNGMRPVSVPYLYLYELPGFAESYTETFSTVGYDNEIITGMSRFRGQLGLRGHLPGENTKFSMVGLVIGSHRSGLVTIFNQPFKFIYQLVNAKLGDIVGSLEYDEKYDLQLIEGSVSASAEIPINLTFYPAPPDPIE